MRSGIYEIRSIIKPDRIYIGSSLNIRKRWEDHKSELMHNRHANSRLQNHYNKYGQYDLEYSIILLCSKPDLIKMEQIFIDNRDPYFNICKTAGNRLNCKHTEETKIKLRLANLGKKQSEETIKKKSVSLKGHAVSDKAREASRRNGSLRKGKKLSQEEIEKIISRTRGIKRKPHSEETKRRIGLKSKGRAVSDDRRKKISLAMKGNQHTKGRIMSKEEKEKRRLTARPFPNRKSQKGMKRSDAFKQKIKESWIIRKQNKAA